MICEPRLAKNFSYQPTKIMLKEFRERERESAQKITAKKGICLIKGDAFCFSHNHGSKVTKINESVLMVMFLIDFKIEM